LPFSWTGGNASADNCLYSLENPTFHWRAYSQSADPFLIYQSTQVFHLLFLLLPFFWLLKLMSFMDSAVEALLPSGFLAIFSALAIPFLAAARCSGLRLIILRSNGQYAYGSSLSFLLISSFLASIFISSVSPPRIWSFPALLNFPGVHRLETACFTPHIWIRVSGLFLLCFPSTSYQPPFRVDLWLIIWLLLSFKVRRWSQGWSCFVLIKQVKWLIF